MTRARPSIADSRPFEGSNKLTYQALSAFLLLIAAAWAQAPGGQGQSEISSRDTPVTFSSRVNLVSVPVVVRDRDGRAVGGLKQEDFRLFDNGKPQMITKFTIESLRAALPPVARPERESKREALKAGPAPPAASAETALPDRFIVFVVDDVGLSLDDLARAKAAALGAVKGLIDPTTRAAIFTTSGKVTLDFTDDREKLAQAFSQIKPLPVSTGGQADCPSISYYQARRILDLGDFEALESGEIDYLAKCAPPSANDNLGLEMARAGPIVKMMASRELGVGEQTVRDDLNLLRRLIERLGPMPGRRTIVLISTGFFLTDDRRREEETDLIDRAIRANVNVSSLDTRSIFANTTQGNAEVPFRLAPVEHIRQEFEQKRAFADQAVMQELADGTGGNFLHNDNDLKGGLDQLAARPEFLYVLGFSPQNLKLDGSYHNLKVTGRNVSSLTIQARRGYWAPNHAVDAAEAAQEELREDVFSRDEIHEIPVDLHTEFFKSSADKAELTVTALLNPDNLRFRKTEERNDDTVTVVAGVFDGNGNYVAGIQKVVQLRLRDRTLTALRNAGIGIEETFHLAPGRYMIRLVVKDAGGETTAARNEGVEIP
jgi:VWFA-related protein